MNSMKLVQKIVLSLSFALVGVLVAALAVVLTTDTAEAAGKKTYLQRVSVSPAKKPATKKLALKTSQKAGPKANQKAKESGKRLGREFVFDGSNVNGQYHSAGEAVAKVEQEKKMNDLVGMRRDFKDRLGAEKERLQRGEEP